MSTFSIKREIKLVSQAIDKNPNLNYNISRTIHKLEAAFMAKGDNWGGAREGAGRPSIDVKERFLFTAPDSLYPKIKERAAELDLALNTYLRQIGKKFTLPAEDRRKPMFTEPLKPRLTFRSQDDEDEIMETRAIQAGLTQPQFLLRACMADILSPEEIDAILAAKKPVKQGYVFRAPDSLYPRIKVRAAETGVNVNTYITDLAERFTLPADDKKRKPMFSEILKKRFSFNMDKEPKKVILQKAKAHVLTVNQFILRACMADVCTPDEIHAILNPANPIIQKYS